MIIYEITSEESNYDATKAQESIFRSTSWAISIAHEYCKFVRGRVELSGVQKISVEVRALFSLPVLKIVPIFYSHRKT